MKTNNIILSEHAGFCFGVRRAVDTVMRLMEEIPPYTHIYTIGKLIHNSRIIRELEEGGVRVIEPDDIDAIYSATAPDSRSIIVIRTHGVTCAITEKLRRCEAENPYFSVVDCTCVHVKRIHTIVTANTDETTLTVIVGDEKHPEVRGIRSYARGDVAVCGSADEIVRIPNIADRRALMVAQTTQKLTEWKKCQKKMRKVCTNALVFDTICSVTETRQTEADELSKNVDLMLVIGGKDSSNTNKLYQTAKQNLEQTFLVENISDLPLDLLTPHLKVGITAGASTPSSIIEEVKFIMNENTPDIIRKTPEAAEDFAGMLENSLKTLNTGETVKGIITSITPNEIHVDLKAKVTGIIPLAEITDNPNLKLEEIYKVGDEIEVIVVKVSDFDGVATLSRKRIENALNWRTLVDACKDGTVMEGRVTDAVKGGVTMNINGLRVFVPASQSGLPREADLSTLVGTTQRVKIIETTDQRRRAVASIRAVLREERKHRETEFWENVEEGKHYDGVVKSLTPFGAFVDLGGVDGMIHTSELSWVRINHPSEVVSIGDNVSVYIKAFDKEAKRISLGYKTEEDNPWKIFMEKYKVGDIVPVKIVSMMPFGAFAQVVPGADGLIHISQIAGHKLVKPSDALELNQIVDAKIIGVDEENHKISLSIRAALEDAANAAEESAEEDAENAE